MSNEKKDVTIPTTVLPERPGIEEAACFLLQIKDDYPDFVLEICTLMNVLDAVHKANAVHKAKV